MKKTSRVKRPVDWRLTRDALRAARTATQRVNGDERGGLVDTGLKTCVCGERDAVSHGYLRLVWSSGRDPNVRE